MNRRDSCNELGRISLVCLPIVMALLAIGDKGVAATGNQPKADGRIYSREVILSIERLGGGVSPSQAADDRGKEYRAEFDHAPYSLAVDNQGSIYLSFKRVPIARKYDSRGKYLRSFAWGKGDGQGIFWKIHVDRQYRLVAISKDGRGNMRFDRILPSGKADTRFIGKVRKGPRLGWFDGFFHGRLFDPYGVPFDDGWIGEKASKLDGHLWPADVIVTKRGRLGTSGVFGLEVGGRSAIIGPPTVDIGVDDVYLGYIDSLDNIYLVCSAVDRNERIGLPRGDTRSGNRYWIVKYDRRLAYVAMVACERAPMGPVIAYSDSGDIYQLWATPSQWHVTRWVTK